MKTKFIKATEVQTGMRLKRPFYNETIAVTGVSVGVSHVRIDLADGSHEYHRHSGTATKPAIEVAQ